MRLCTTLLGWFSLVMAVALANKQEFIGGDDVSSYNLTLHFDDLSTDESGIGYNPKTNSTPLHCGDLYFQSFTVVNVAKAQKHLPDPVDLLCADSAPNALFSRRRAGHPWPRFSLHSLTDPSLPRDPNVMFNMRSVSISPTGSIPQDALVIIWLNFLKLPPDEWLGQGEEHRSFRDLLEGEPPWPKGRLYQLIAFFGPGPHPNLRIDWDSLRMRLPDIATKVDTFEVYGQLLQRAGPNEPYLVQGDWELCLDDVAVEIVRKTGRDEHQDSQETRNPRRVFVFADEDGSAIGVQKRAEKLIRELGL
ncbi:hypothetical protein CLAIMM_04279 [Cladophialophora immunda]|nr:hypothetical protein CLAIMM_04279 [Cladophialophora immunda]